MSDDDDQPAEADEPKAKTKSWPIKITPGKAAANKALNDKMANAGIAHDVFKVPEHIAKIATDATAGPTVPDHIAEQLIEASKPHRIEIPDSSAMWVEMAEQKRQQDEDRRRADRRSRRAEIIAGASLVVALVAAIIDAVKG